MKLWTKAVAGAAAIALGLGAAQAQAAIIDWTLSDGAFDDGGAFSGTFTFDNVTDSITDWSVSTTLGDGSPAASYSSPGGCVFIFCSSASDNGSGPTFNASFFIFGSTFELTNIPMGAPGAVTGLTGDESGATGFPLAFLPFSHTVTGGTATGVLAAPEPASWALMIGGLGLAGASLRFKRRLARA
jgi:hypothetical protein